MSNPSGPRRRFVDSKSVSFSLDGPTRALIERLARAEVLSKADVVRRAVAAWGALRWPKRTGQTIVVDQTDPMGLANAIRQVKSGADSIRIEPEP